MRTTVICTVLNEGEAIRRLLDSLCRQTLPPDEVVIVDGGSRDNTVAVIHEYAGRLPLMVLSEPGANISRGRNIAIRAATGEIIASTDAGVWLEPDWLERLLAPYEGSCEFWPQAVAGFFVPDPQTPFEAALGATVLPAAGEIDPRSFLPSSRSVAFSKKAWLAADGYPEWLDYCEDLIFDFCLRSTSGEFAWAPDAVAHFRPRSNLRAFFTQYYRYARGDGKADLWRKRHAVRYATYFLGLPALLLGLRGRLRPLALLGLVAGTVAYTRTPYRRLAPQLPGRSLSEQIKMLALVPVIRVTGDIAKILGYKVGWLWRLKNWKRPEIHWQAGRSRL